MFKKFFILVVCLSVFGCVTSGTKIKVTDPETGNSVTIDKEGVELDIKEIEKDGIKVEVLDDKESK